MLRSFRSKRSTSANQKVLNIQIIKANHIFHCDFTAEPLPLPLPMKFREFFLNNLDGGIQMSGNLFNVGESLINHYVISLTGVVTVVGRRGRKMTSRLRGSRCKILWTQCSCCNNKKSVTWNSCRMRYIQIQAANCGSFFKRDSILFNH